MLDSLRQDVLTLLANEEAEAFLQKNDLEYGRYRRDQCVNLKKTVEQHPEWAQIAIEKCIEEN